MADTNIVVTEIMYDPVNTVNDNNYEWVEVANTGTDPVSLDGWTLDDSRTGNAGVGVIPDVTLAPGDIAIFYNDNITEAEFVALFAPAPGTVLIPVARWQPLNNTGGDTVNLVNAAGTNIAEVTYSDDASPAQSLNYTPDGVYEGAGVPDPGIICFTAGSMIACPGGERHIEHLQIGDLVHTRDRGIQPVRWVGRRLVSVEEQRRNPAFCPVEIQASAFGAGVPLRATKVSQQHRILVESPVTELYFGQPRVLCAAIGLVNGKGICQMPPDAPVEYIHLLFDHHEVLKVDGLPSESFHPGVSGLDTLSALARAEVYALFPELEHGQPMPIAYPALTMAEAALMNG